MPSRASPLDLMALMVEAERMNQRWLQFINNAVGHWQREHGDTDSTSRRNDMFYLTNDEVLLVGWDYVAFCKEQVARHEQLHNKVTNKEKHK